MKNWQKQYPPYEGGEGYLYFAFADGDAGKVWPVMRTLLQRGVRVWYCGGPAGSAETGRQTGLRGPRAAEKTAAETPECSKAVLSFYNDS